MSSAEYQREWYQRNKEAHIARVKVRRDKYRAEVQAYIAEAKNVPCMDCGIRYPPYVMDFDHRDGEEKVAAIGTAGAHRWNLPKLRAEIEKCDVVCSNCHRERTHQRRLLGSCGRASV